MRIQLSNGTEMSLQEFIADYPEAVFYDDSGFECFPDSDGNIEPDPWGSFPILAYENEEDADSARDGADTTAGSIDPPIYHVDEAMLPNSDDDIDLEEFCVALAEIIEHRCLVVPVTDSYNGADNSRFEQSGYRISTDEWNAALKEVEA